ncbi:MAG: hypothetical protein KF886_23510 [Candidatus Hydrogenedentes bacterium]|nr:hypothetical protein [Candidatus Hydrogenedentota bacterium]
MAEMLLAEVQPVPRGSIYWVPEHLWGETNPGYSRVQREDRKGHFGCATTRDDATPFARIPILHGHTKNTLVRYSIRVDNLVGDGRGGYFDVLHRFMFMREQFYSSRGGIRPNRHKSSLDSGELAELKRVEMLISSEIQCDLQQVRKIFKEYPAWSDCDLAATWQVPTANCSKDGERNK